MAFWIVGPDFPQCVFVEFQTGLSTAFSGLGLGAFVHYLVNQRKMAEDDLSGTPLEISKVRHAALLRDGRWFAAARPLAGRGQGHDGVYFTKNQVDAAGDAGHDCPSGYRDETGHEGIFNKILAATVLPNSRFSN